MVDINNFDSSQLEEMIPLLEEQGKELLKDGEELAVVVTNEGTDKGYALRVCAMIQTSHEGKIVIAMSRVLEMEGKILKFTLKDLKSFIGK